MSGKFIPNGDSEFAVMARVFADNIAKDWVKYGVSADESAMLSTRVRAYRDALARSRGTRTRTPSAILLKDEARRKAEEAVRLVANAIRGNGKVSPADKVALKIRERPKKLGKRTVPFAAPELFYLGVPPRVAPNSGLHWLGFKDGFQAIHKSKPNGAVRVEIFVDLVACGDPIPQFPGQYLGGRPWYLRSFSKSPIRVRHPMPPVPMQVVYWARWADAKGDVGPFSRTCVAHVEGGFGTTGNLLGAMPDVTTLANDPKYLTTITQFRERLLEGVTVERRMWPDEAETTPAAPKPMPMNGSA